MTHLLSMTSQFLANDPHLMGKEIGYLYLILEDIYW